MQENISLKPYNTFGVDVKSKYFAEVCSLEELIETLKFSNSIKLPLLFLGGGSNILLTKDFEGLAIQLNLKELRKKLLTTIKFLLPQKLVKIGISL